MDIETLRRIFAHVCLVGILAIPLFAAQQQQGEFVRRKFDEFIADRSLARDDMKARLDSFYDNGLKNEPTARAYIIIYRGKYHTSRYTSSVVRNYLTLRGLSATHVTIVYGGYRNKPTMELWIVPENDPPPKPTPTFFPKRDNKGS